MHIIGTAGHVDHGKSSLVEALTGVHPDRWAEERLRGMTLDLGFARLRYDGVDAGIVDVPGHERFIHNMVAGAAGVEVVLLVVALNEGVRQQTREHLQILALLGIERLVVAATKSDAVWDIDACTAQVAAQLTDTIAATAPVVPVSSRTGAGLDDLRAHIASMLAALPERAARAPVYLPVDRVFALSGHGTIVTGSLVQGTIGAGDTVVLRPHDREVRVRSLHVFGEAVKRASAGSRVAANLAAVDRTGVSRGNALTGAEYAARTSFRVRFTALPEALPLLGRRTPVRAHIGTAEIMGTLVFPRAPSGDGTSAELFLRSAVVGFPGLRFIVRRPSPKTVLGGGVIEGMQTAAESGEVPSGVDAVLLQLLRERALAPTEPAQAAFLSNLREPVAIEALERLVERGDALRLERPAAFLDATAARELLARVVSELEAREEREPWAMGVTVLTLSRALDVPEVLLLRAIAAFAEDGALRVAYGYVSTPGYRPVLSAEQERFFNEAVAVHASSPNVPVPFSDVADRMRHSGIAGVSKAFDTLVARGSLVKVGTDIYRGSQISTMHRAIDAFVRDRGAMTVADFRSLTGTSRKFAVPLLEWFDARGVTIRNGDHRTMRQSASGAIARQP